jgi:deoxyribodipyrimidine photo-lyase
MPTYGIHIFRRDYRIIDNTSLLSIATKVDKVIPLFIFTKTQIDNKKNTYKSNNCVQFLVESLLDLDAQIRKVVPASKLRVYYGDEYEILTSLLHKNPEIRYISFNADYTKFSRERDAKIKAIAASNTPNPVNIISEDDILLHPLGTIKTTTGKTYTKFTPFLNASLAQIKTIPEPSRKRIKNFIGAISLHGPAEYNGDLKHMHDSITNTHIPERGGRTNGLKILKRISSAHTWTNYNQLRDQLSYNTTHLSPFNKFGCISIREVFWVMKRSLGINNGLIRQLVWRDFFYNLSATHDYIYATGPMNTKWNDIPWENDATKWHAWQTGKTGYPVVDACMAEINTTGYMHNRGRLIVSNFLTRILHIDWRWGERYFAQHLYDYDPAQNSFGWQINAAVSGTESRPLSQTILNPWIQSAKYDPEAVYIKKWLPHLSNIPASDLHKWESKHSKHDLDDLTYYKPIVDYTTEKEKNLRIYRRV